MPDLPRWTDAKAWGGAPLKFLPIPLTVSIGQLNPQRRWRVSLANGLHVENVPPWRLILVGDRTVACYPVADEVQERLALVALVAQGWMSAAAWAAAWGLHRNTLSNWAWRYRHFGLDGLCEGLLPERPRLQAIVSAGQELVAAQPGVGLTVAALEQELGRRELGGLPRRALQWLSGELTAARSSSGDGQAPRPKAGPGLLPADPDPSGDGDQARPSPSSADQESPQSAVETEDAAKAVTAQDSAPVPDGPAATRTDAVRSLASTDHESPPAAVGTEDGAKAETPLASAPVPDGPAPTLLVPPRPSAVDVSLREAGVALILPEAQTLLEPLAPFLEAHYGERPWYYRPLDMVLAFIFYVVLGFQNPEQVKAAPTLDFGPLLGRRRGPACITLRRRLPPLAENLALVEELQRRLAEAYLRLGWVVPGWWLLDGHFSPYLGQQEWGKGWWPQRRMPQKGYCQDWIHDRRGRPLWMHVTQGFELFADQIPIVADGLQEVLTAADVAEPLLLVFDRGGYNSEVFRSLNARGVGWVTWLKGGVVLGPEAFTETCELPPSRPGEPARTVHYACYTHRVQGCHDAVAAIAWHFGDAAHPVALLHNTDRCQPDRWSAPQLIAMLEGRWSQENGFKAMTQQVDVDWTNGYVHEPCAQTPVPNPESRRLRAKLAERTAQVRRAVNKPTPRQPAAAARYRRRLGTLRGQVTLLTRRVAQTPATVAYSTLGRRATTQLRPGRGLLFPVLRAAAYHLRLQLHDHIAAVFPDYREQDKVLRVLLHTPGRYARTADGDWLVFQRPHLPRYAAAMAAILTVINTHPPHAPGCPGRQLHFALED